MVVYFEQSLLVGDTQVFSVTDVTGRNLAGATVKITYPFEERIRTETLTTDATGRAEFMVTNPGTYSFTVSKPSFYPFFGEFNATGEPITPPVGFEFDMNLIYLVILVIIIAGVAYYMLVLRKK
jgi:hypothetical protein